MVNIYIDKKYKFFEIFNKNNGMLFRSNVIGTEEDAYCRSFPELLDVGIMGHCDAAKKHFCSSAGIDCYQNGLFNNNENMPFENYVWLINQCKGKVFQVALGGSGDPNKHEDFDNILQYTHENQIVPNLTTSGYLLDDNEIKLIKKYCGAVAVSFYSRLKSNSESNPVTINSIRNLVKEGCITNIHYVVSSDNIDECIYRLENEIFPQGINAIIFLLYKPVGQGKNSKILRCNNRLIRFLDLATNKKHNYKVGFDTCFVTALYNSQTISKESMDFCEAARFSMYIDSTLKAFPCSFGCHIEKYGIQLKPKTIQEVWDGKVFNKFVNSNNFKCNNCSEKETCEGGCKLNLDINLCKYSKNSITLNL